MEEKRCSKCGEVKAVSEFSKDASKRDGRRFRCKACRCVDDKKYREANPEKVRAKSKKYCEANREKLRAKAGVYYAANPEKCRARSKAYREADPEKLRAKAGVYYAANPEKCRARSKAYREADPEKVLAIQKAWREANRGKERARHKKYREANPEKRCATAALRRARKNGAAGQATAEQRAARWEVFGGKCYICGAPAEAIDHVVPLARGGSNWPANLRPICNRCNSTKGAKWPFNIERARSEMNHA